MVQLLLIATHLLAVLGLWPVAARPAYALSTLSTRAANGWLTHKAVSDGSLTQTVTYQQDYRGRITGASTGPAGESYSYDLLSNPTTAYNTAEGTWNYAPVTRFSEVGTRTNGTQTESHVWDPVSGRMSQWDTVTVAEPEPGRGPRSSDAVA